MLDYILAIGAGTFSGLVWEYLGNKPHFDFPALMPSLFVKWEGRPLHLHHWLAYAFILVVLSLFAYKTNRLSHPAIIFLLSFFGSALITGFFILDGLLNFRK